MNAPFFNFVNLAGGNRLRGKKQVWSLAVQEAAKREDRVPVTLKTVGGVKYEYLSRALLKNGVPQAVRER